MTAEQRYAELAEAFLGTPLVTHADGTRGFGSSALKVDGKIFAMLVGGRLVVKLPRRRVEELIAAGDGEPFHSGQGRPMREWLTIDPSADWPLVASEALAFVRSGIAPRSR